MKMVVKKIIRLFIILIVINILPFANKAQGTPTDPCTDPIDPCPIDGGVSLLIAAGISIAAKKAYDRKKQKQVSL
jgi:hypothetical protein